MSLFKDLRNYVLEEEFKIIYLNNKLEVINYIDISHFDTSKIIITYKSGELKVTGKNLVVSKLLSDELLIEGNILNIKLGDYYEE